MNGTTAIVARARSQGGTHVRGGFARVLAFGLMAAMLVPMLMTVFSSSASAAEDDERANYSLYQLASNASTYFSTENSPAGESDPDDRMTPEWRAITNSPATGGSLLGYADPEFSMGNVVGWFFAEVSGSSQTIRYETLKAEGDNGNVYSGMLDYAHFGAANADLGLDTMSSGIGGQIASMISGSVIWLFYGLAIAVSMIFSLVIKLLQLVNPFLWFGNAVSEINKTFGQGMTRGEEAPAALKGLSNFISDWYGLINSIAWEALVPLFIGFLLIGLVLFKKMDRGSAIKKFVVRLVFIGVGLPLIGSMYTGVLDKFDDSLTGQQAGPTRVVLSTYVDFEAWAMNDRLGIPDAATIAWEDGQASSDAMMSVRTSALAINRQSNDVFAGIGMTARPGDATSAWRNGTVGMDDSGSGSDNAVFATFGIINGYITSEEVAASDFESGIKSSITKLGVDAEDWFVSLDSYGDPEEFGEDEGPEPTQHPVISTSGQAGLSSSNPGGSSTTFTTTGTQSGCGFDVMEAGAPASCNLSPLSMYNYLNTSFDSTSLTMYSANNATSGFTRESHMAVSQVGTGPAKFMYWANAATVLGSIALLGFWYAIGMLAGAVKRTFSLVAAVPFATLGAVSAIGKVIVYTVALILEVLVSLFIYQFVSEFLISIPGIIAGPMSVLVSGDGLLGSSTLGGIAVVIMTLISTLLIIGVTFALLRTRKVVLQALDEVFTKLVDKFLDTNTTPKPDKSSGMMPAMASGLGAGAGMAAGSKLSSGFNGKPGGGSKPQDGGKSNGQSMSTNAGGTNGGPKALTAGTGTLALGSGEGGNHGPDGSQHGPGGDDGPGNHPGSGSDGGVRALPGGSGPEGARGVSGQGEGTGDKGGALQQSGPGRGSSRSDKATAQNLSQRGGLSPLGFSSGPQNGSGGGADNQTHFGTGGGAASLAAGGSDSGSQGGDSSESGVAGVAGAAGSSRTAGDRKALAGTSTPTQFGTGQQQGVPAAGAAGSHGSAQGSSKGPRFTAGADGAAQVNAGAAAAAAVPGAAGAAGASNGHGAASTRSTRASQGHRPQGQVGTGAGGSAQSAQPLQGNQQPNQSRNQNQAKIQQNKQGQAPVQPGQQQARAQQAPARPALAPDQSRPAQPADSGNGAKTAQASPSAPQPQAPAQRPAAPAPRQQPGPAGTAPKPSPSGQQGTRAAAGSSSGGGSSQSGTSGQPPERQAPARPKRVADPAPKRTDVPVSRRKPGKPKG